MARHREHVPPDAEPGQEPPWPPADRAAALADARRQREETGGLPVDDATLERVVDAAHDPRYHLPGLWFTAEEAADDVGDALREVVHAYLEARPSVAGGARLGWEEGRRTIVAGVADDPAPHLRALRSRAGPDEDRVRVVRVSCPLTELRALQQRIAADTATGYAWASMSADAFAGVVELAVTGGPDRFTAERELRARYGPVHVRWLGPSREREVPHPFGSYATKGRRLTVYFGIAHNGERPGSARVVAEHEDRVEVEVTQVERVGPRSLVGGFSAHEAHLELSESLGDRAVIDASCGRPRPRSR